MPLIARKETESTKVLSVRLPETVLELLDEYARYVNSDRGYVVGEALRYVFAEDTDFAAAHGLTRRRRAKRPANVSD